MSEQVIDETALEKLMSLIGGDAEDLAELIDDYVEQAPQLVTELETATATGDLDGMRRAAHTLKSTARDFGAKRLSELAEAFEHACRDGRTEHLAEEVPQIAAAEAQARAALSEIPPERIAGA